MTRILGIDTTTKACSVALLVDGSCTEHRMINAANYSHAENLHRMIDEVLQSSNCAPNALDAVAVSRGPGSYTGLRIGVSAAKGLCYGLGVPLISINTLQLLCESEKLKAISAQRLCPMIDARRNEVYTAVFDAGGEIIEPYHALVLDDHLFGRMAEKYSMAFFGDGAGKFESQFSHTNAVFLSEIFPDAANMGRLADFKFQSRDFEDVAYFDPFYGKEFVAGKPKKSVLNSEKQS